jgi:hypothetical protein
MNYPDAKRSSKLVFCWWPTEVDNHELVWLKWVRKNVVATVIEQHVEVTYYTKLLPQEEWDSGK